MIKKSKPIPYELVCTIFRMTDVRTTANFAQTSRASYAEATKYSLSKFGMSLRDRTRECFIVRFVGSYCLHTEILKKKSENSRLYTAVEPLIPITDRESLLAGAEATENPINKETVLSLLRILDMYTKREFNDMSLNDFNYFIQMLYMGPLGLGNFSYFIQMSSSHQMIAFLNSLSTLFTAKKGDINFRKEIISLAKSIDTTRNGTGNDECKQILRPIINYEEITLFSHDSKIFFFITMLFAIYYGLAA